MNSPTGSQEETPQPLPYRSLDPHFLAPRADGILSSMDAIRDFTTGLANARTFEDLCAYFTQVITPLGFYAFTFGSAPLRRGQLDSSGAVLHSTLPQSFQDEYRARQMDQFDPVFELTASRYLPFTKSAIEPIVVEAPEKKSMHDLAEHHDIGEALIVPIATFDRARGVVLFSKLRAPQFEELIAEKGPLLHIMALYVMDRAEQFDFGRTSTSDEVTLTPREAECLRLCAQGKTIIQASKALGVSERTVRFHLGNAYEKLGVSGRSHAVTRALQLGLIRI